MSLDFLFLISSRLKDAVSILRCKNVSILSYSGLIFNTFKLNDDMTEFTLVG